MAKTGPKANLASQLLDWYRVHARALPWRARPGEQADPYRVWLSEIMLQQTTVPAVKGYFLKFIEAWPAVESLAATPLDDVLKAWAGLGYYARARNLHACARVVAGQLGGRFPETVDELRKLPGIGPYTAGAIAAIAFGKPHAAVDGNVERVISRLYAIETPLPDSKPEIRERAEALVPQQEAGDFAQAMMDLGAGVCSARAPQCLLCPLTDLCEARKTGEPERFPVKPPKKAKPVRKGRAFWIEREGAVLLVRRPGTGMLGGMRALPDDGWSARGDGSGDTPLAGDWQSVGSVQHVFTHFALEMSVLVWSGEECCDPTGEHGEWWPVSGIDEAGLPTLFGKAARLVMAQREERGG